MQSPEIGTVGTMTLTFLMPCQEDDEQWVIEFDVEIHRISRTIWDYYWKGKGLSGGQGRIKQQPRYYAVKMRIERSLHTIAFAHAMEWSDMDWQLSGAPVIPVPQLSTEEKHNEESVASDDIPDGFEFDIITLRGAAWSCYVSSKDKSSTTICCESGSRKQGLNFSSTVGMDDLPKLCFDALSHVDKS